jgi:hypothetical protein
MPLQSLAGGWSVSVKPRPHPLPCRKRCSASSSSLQSSCALQKASQKSGGSRRSRPPASPSRSTTAEIAQTHVRKVRASAPATPAPADSVADHEDYPKRIEAMIDTTSDMLGSVKPYRRQVRRRAARADAGYLIRRCAASRPSLAVPHHSRSSFQPASPTGSAP